MTAWRTVASDEIERFRREMVARTGDRRQAESLSDQGLLREVMNTVGVAGRLGGSERRAGQVAVAEPALFHSLPRFARRQWYVPARP